MKNYIAIAEPADDGTTWWISFPDLPGVTSAADGASRITTEAQDALASAIDAGAVLPPAVEDGGIPSYDLGEYHNPLVVLVPLAAPIVVEGTATIPTTASVHVHASVETAEKRKKRRAREKAER